MPQLVRIATSAVVLLATSCSRGDEPIAQNTAPNPALTTSSPVMQPRLAPSATPVKRPDSILTWRIPEGWRPLPVPKASAMRAHFILDQKEEGAGRKDRVHVYVIQNRGVKGNSPDARFEDAKKRERDPFAKIKSEKEEERSLGDLEIALVEISGTLKEIRALPKGDEKLEFREKPNHLQITAVVPATDFPYRVVIFGPTDAVEGLRGVFMSFVDSLKLVDPRAPK